MAHYAFLDENNVVTEVITGIDEDQLIDGISPEEWYGNFRNQKCVRTSYHGNIRKNSANIGYIYNETLDAFIPAKPYESWMLNEDTCTWQAPTLRPVDDKQYIWDEETTSWIEVIS